MIVSNEFRLGKSTVQTNFMVRTPTCKCAAHGMRAAKRAQKPLLLQHRLLPLFQRTHMQLSNHKSQQQVSLYKH